jgi:hypothetical protein
MVNPDPEKKKPLVGLAVIQKTRILQCFSFGLEGFHQDLEIGFFRTWTGFFRTRTGFFRIWISDSTLVSLRIWIGYFYRIGYIKSRTALPELKAREHSIL